MIGRRYNCPRPVNTPPSLVGFASFRSSSSSKLDSSRTCSTTLLRCTTSTSLSTIHRARCKETYARGGTCCHHRRRGTIIDGTIFQRKNSQRNPFDTTGRFTLQPAVKRSVSWKQLARWLWSLVQRGLRISSFFFFFFFLRFAFCLLGPVSMLSGYRSSRCFSVICPLKRRATANLAVFSENVITAYRVQTSSSSWVRRYPLPRDGYVTAAVNPYLISCRYTQFPSLMSNQRNESRC